MMQLQFLFIISSGRAKWKDNERTHTHTHTLHTRQLELGSLTVVPPLLFTLLSRTGFPPFLLTVFNPPINNPHKTSTASALPIQLACYSSAAGGKQVAGFL